MTTIKQQGPPDIQASLTPAEVEETEQHLKESTENGQMSRRVINKLRQLQQVDDEVEVGHVSLNSNWQTGGGGALEFSRDLDLGGVAYQYDVHQPITRNDDEARFFATEDARAISRENELLQLYVRIRAGEENLRQQYAKKETVRQALKLKGEVMQTYHLRPSRYDAPSTKPAGLEIKQEGGVTYKPQQRSERPIDEGPKKKRPKVDAIPKAQLQDKFFALFQKQSSWTLRELIREINQPVNWLKECLNEIAIFNVKGEFRGSYTLKKEYQSQ